MSLQGGHFYDGTITAVGYHGGRVAIAQAVVGRAEPVDQSRGAARRATFTTTVIRARTDYAFSPRMFASALLQYSSTDHTFSSNLRFRWEYRPGSEFFVVYTDEHDTLGSRVSGPEEPRVRRENQSPAALLALASRGTRLGRQLIGARRFPRRGRGNLSEIAHTNLNPARKQATCSGGRLTGRRKGRRTLPRMA